MALFDREASQYDDFFATPLGAFVDAVEKRALFEALSDVHGARVLEVGAGTGTLTLELARRGARVTAIDISEVMLEEAQEKAKKESLTIEFRRMNAHALDFKDETFDIVVSMATFEFLGAPGVAYAAMRRVVKPGGHIFIGTINALGEWAALYHSEAFKDTVFKHADFLSEAKLRALDPSQCLNVRHTLFTPPGAPENALTTDNEALHEKEKTEGGFLWAHFQKHQ